MSPRLLLAPLNGVLDDVNHLLVDASVFALCKDLQLAMKPRAHSQCDFPAVCRHCVVTSLLLYSAVTLLSRCCPKFFLKVVIPLPSDLPKFTLRTDKQTLDKFRVVAQKNLRTVNRELEMLMRQHIADYEDKHGEIVLPQNQD